MELVHDNIQQVTVTNMQLNNLLEYTKTTKQLMHCVVVSITRNLTNSYQVGTEKFLLVTF